jgi:hypothetical protein
MIKMRDTHEHGRILGIAELSKRKKHLRKSLESFQSFMGLCDASPEIIWRLFGSARHEALGSCKPRAVCAISAFRMISDM